MSPEVFELQHKILAAAAKHRDGRVFIDSSLDGYTIQAGMQVLAESASEIEIHSYYEALHDLADKGLLRPGNAWHTFYLTPEGKKAGLTPPCPTAAT